MENLWLSFTIIFPLLCWMALGYLARLLLRPAEEWAATSNKLTFNLFIPMLLFKNMVESDIAAQLTPATLGLVGYILGGLLVTFLVLLFLVPRFEKENARRSVMVQGIFRSNIALFGIPIALALYGEGQTGPVVLVVGLSVIFYNILTVFLFEYFRGRRVKSAAVALQIAKNPLVLSLVAGMAVSLLGLVPPAWLMAPVNGLANVATPFSFVVLGMGFSFASAQGNKGRIAAAVVGKLVVVPLVWLGLAVLLGFRGVALAAVLVMFAPSTAVSTAPMAHVMGGDTRLAGEIVVFSSIFSMPSMFLWLFVLKQLALL